MLLFEKVNNLISKVSELEGDNPRGEAMVRKDEFGDLTKFRDISYDSRERKHYLHIEKSDGTIYKIECTKLTK